MVNSVLHDYVQGLRRRMVHIPLRVQRRLVNEIIAHVEADMVELRREHRDWSTEKATHEAIERFCPLEDALPLYGPEEGVIRRSTAEWIVRAPKDEPRRTLLEGRKWGAAAAGLAVVGLIAALVAFTPSPGTGTDLGAEAMQPGDIMGAWHFGNLTGSMETELTAPAVDAMVLSAQGDGCLRVSLLSPTGDTYEHPGCLDTDWTLTAPAAGDWLLSFDAEAFTGSLTVTAA